MGSEPYSLYGFTGELWSKGAGESPGTATRCAEARAEGGSGSVPLVADWSALILI